MFSTTDLKIQTAHSRKQPITRLRLHRGSAIAKIVGANAAKYDRFVTTVNMWVFEETVDGRKLTEIINTDHENVKYLPGHKLPPNVVSMSASAFAPAAFCCSSCGCCLLIIWVVFFSLSSVRWLSQTWLNQ